MSLAPPLVLNDRRSPPSAPSRRARELGDLSRTRIANTWVRLGACALVALVTAGATGGAAPFIWLAGFVPILLIERALYRRLLRQCEADAPPRHVWQLAFWIMAQTLYVGVLVVMLWFAKYAHGETLAVILMLASLGNAAATLRSSLTLSLASSLPTMTLLAVLPLLDYFMGAFRNPLDLLPVISVALFLGFGYSLWRSLRACDEAQARAEAAALRERQAAAAAAAAKSDAIRRMQDEMRTPMTALMSAAEHLRRAPLSSEARAYIGALAQASDVLHLVLQDLADLDSLENGQLRIAPTPCDPREIARSVFDAFRAAAQDKRLELFLDIAPETPTAVLMDGARVRQILFNLVANAVKYTSHGGVRLRLQVQPSETAGRVRLGYSVADTGAGLSRSQLALIMGRARPSGEGAGLGLAISQRLARLMGARLGAKSELGEGSVFSLVLEAPLLTAEARTAAMGG